MFGWIRKIAQRPVAPQQPSPALRLQRLEKLKRIVGAYDAAQTTDYNVRHWKGADTLSADSANSPEVRRTLRSRARYEAHESNSYAKGICLTLANDVIGRGPRLQMLSRDRATNQLIEAAFARWAKRVGLAEKLRTMRLSKAIDGEAFAQLTTNRRLSPFDVQLDLKLIEADQVTDPTFIPDPSWIDGVQIDEDGNPVRYRVMRVHPGHTLNGFANPLAFDDLSAEDVIHIFRADRPGQHRGIPEITPALPLFAMLRDFSLAVLSSAKTAAKFSAVLETNSAARADDGANWDPDVEAFDFVDIDYDVLTSLPFGWSMKQFKAEQPTTTFEQFRDAMLGEIARCLNMPWNIALGNSSRYNYASGRLDHQTYFKSIDVERAQWEPMVLDRILASWFDEAVLVPGLIPEGLGPLAELDHQWYWDGREHVDPTKEAGGQQIKLKSGTTHRVREYAQMGLDVDAEDEKAAASYGVSVQDYRQALFQSHFNGGQSAPSDEQPDDAENADEDTDDTDTDEETDGDETEEARTAQAAA